MATDANGDANGPVEAVIMNCDYKFKGDVIMFWAYVSITVLSIFTLVARCYAARSNGLPFKGFHLSIFCSLILVSVVRVHHVSAECVGDITLLSDYPDATLVEIVLIGIRNLYLLLPYMNMVTVFLLFLQDSFKIIHAVYITFHDVRGDTDVVPRQHIFWCVVCGRAHNMWNWVTSAVVFVWMSALFALDTGVAQWRGPLIDIVCFPMLVIATMSVFRTWKSIKNLQLAALNHAAPRCSKGGGTVDDSPWMPTVDSLANLSFELGRRPSVTCVTAGEFPRPLVRPVIQGLKRTLLMSVMCLVVFVWRFVVVTTLIIIPRNITLPTDPLYVYFIFPHLFLSEIIPIGVICVLYLAPAISALRAFPHESNQRSEGALRDFRFGTDPRSEGAESWSDALEMR